MEPPKQKHSDKSGIIKGVKILAVSLVLIVLSTYLLTFTFLNKETLPMYILLPLAIIVMGITIYLLFNGIKTIIKALFD